MPSLKTSVKETMSKLQQQSRMNGGAYGTNEFVSITQTEDQTVGGSQEETYDKDSDY